MRIVPHTPGIHYRQADAWGGATSNPDRLADVLGVAKSSPARRSPLGLIALIESGLPVASLDRVSSFLMPGDTRLKYRIVAKASLARRQRTQRLSMSESARVARLAKTWSSARAVWGSDDEARDFLSRPHQLLEGQRPIDLAIASELGARLVEDILGRLEYGTAM